MGSLRSDSYEKLDGHKAEGLSMGADMKGEVYHKAMEEGWKFSYTHMSNQ
jgi:hypothetical protein